MIDYKGGLITDISDDEGIDGDFDNLETYLEEADAVLVILDGQKLLAFMQSHGSHNEHKNVSRWLHQDLPNLMQMVDECNKHTPVHFIISKWDLLEGSYSLVNIKKHLLKAVPEFSNVVQNRRKVGCPVRLIPVSSLGKGFAALQPDGQMKKLSGNPHPMNVEVPLAFALTERLKNQTDRPKQKPFKLTVWDWVMIGFCIITALHEIVRGIGIVVALVYFGFRLLTNNRKRNERLSSSTLSNEDAFEKVLSNLQEIQKQFNTNFSSSDLAKISSLNSR
ncbi:MAG: hypothetical protein HC878_20825 [Leptolyngbyaceae cyanobacterium SL_5_14]|nr:hypothetical protein [Leptolyngbyaceae cyanobacterium SL_5_14]